MHGHGAGEVVKEQWTSRAMRGIRTGMTPRDLNTLLHTASRCPDSDGEGGRAAAVWRKIRNGWDPERIEWQRWLRRWWPWVLVAVIAAATGMASLPHGKHEASNPPPLGLFSDRHVLSPLSNSP